MNVSVLSFMLREFLKKTASAPTRVEQGGAVTAIVPTVEREIARWLAEKGQVAISYFTIWELIRALGYKIDYEEAEPVIKKIDALKRVYVEFDKEGNVANAKFILLPGELNPGKAVLDSIEEVMYAAPKVSVARFMNSIANAEIVKNAVVNELIAAMLYNNAGRMDEEYEESPLEWYHGKLCLRYGDVEDHGNVKYCTLGEAKFAIWKKSTGEVVYERL